MIIFKYFFNFKNTKDNVYSNKKMCQTLHAYCFDKNCIYDVIETKIEPIILHCHKFINMILDSIFFPKLCYYYFSQI